MERTTNVNTTHFKEDYKCQHHLMKRTTNVNTTL